MTAIDHRATMICHRDGRRDAGAGAESRRIDVKVTSRLPLARSALFLSLIPKNCHPDPEQREGEGPAFGVVSRSSTTQSEPHRISLESESRKLALAFPNRRLPPLPIRPQMLCKWATDRMWVRL
jgi:hypothetical protein